MNTKGTITKQHICEKAYALFAQKGFKQVTMQEICKVTGLSRGGLYRHYSSTKMIFMEIINSLMANQEDEIDALINQHEPPLQILEYVLDKYKKEMLDSKNSLSLAIYEFYSSEQNPDNALQMEYERSLQTWIKIIDYGVKEGAFHDVNRNAIFNLIVFAYQGVRMYSKLITVDKSVPEGIFKEIKKLLIRGDEPHEDSIL